MYNLIMAVIVIATAAAILSSGHNYFNFSRAMQIVDAEGLLSEHMRLTGGIQSYRRTTENFPNESDWRDSVSAHVTAPIATLPEGLDWVYVGRRYRYLLCLDGLDESFSSLPIIAGIVCPDFNREIQITLQGASLPDAEVNASYSGFDFKPHVSVDDPLIIIPVTENELTWSATGLPSGMEMSTGGVLSGTPEAGGFFSIDVSAAYAASSASREYGLIVNDSGGFILVGLGGSGSDNTVTVSLSSSSLPVAQEGVSYSGFDFRTVASITRGSEAPEVTVDDLSWSSAGFPAGMTLNGANGLLTGTPTTFGSFSVAVTATYAESSDTRNYNLVVEESAVSITLIAVTLPDGELNQSYGSFDFKDFVSVTGAVPEDLSWIATGLPPGMSFNVGTGILSGTPSAFGSYSLSITASFGIESDSRTYTLFVNDAEPLVVEG